MHSVPLTAVPVPIMYRYGDALVSSSPFTLILSDAGPEHESGLNVISAVADTLLSFNSQNVTFELKVPPVDVLEEPPDK